MHFKGGISITIYIIQEIDKQGGWGDFGDIIEIFDTREEAEEYCRKLHLIWPTIKIIEKQI